MERSDICRYENKYIIDEATALQIADYIQPICHLDEHTVPGSKGYIIHSLYFDTQSLAFYNANKTQLLTRFKPRVRTYATNPSCPYVWLEMKWKHGTKCHKVRQRIDADDWPHIMTVPRTLLDSDFYNVDGFMSVVESFGALPATHIRYHREAYVSEIDHYVRITFDRNITTAPANGSFELRENDPDLVGSCIPIDDPISFGTDFSPVILEIKCETSVPAWLMGLIRHFGLEQDGVSKYIMGQDMALAALGSRSPITNRMTRSTVDSRVTRV
jgi:hypothetical protein